MSDASRRLRTEPLNDDLIASVAAAVWVPHRYIVAEMMKAFAADMEAYRTIIDDLIAQMTRTISAALAGDTDRVDTLQWIAEWSRSYQRMVPFMIRGAAEALQESLVEADTLAMFCRSPEGGVFRAHVLIGAAEDEATAGGDRQRIGDLVDLAFLELCRGIDASREIMPWLPPFPFSGESRAERGARALRYAEAFRVNGSPEEHAAFQAAIAGRST